MNVLLIGSGGREHALAHMLASSPALTDLAVAPGNAGTASYNVELDVSDHDAVLSWCLAHEVDLVVVGPEAPLVDGLSDRLTGADIACFGPSKSAARLEGSKSFAREFAARHGIPSPQAATFEDSESALAWLDEIDFDVVVKADGLAAGKGVLLPDGRAETEAAIRSLLDEAVLGDSGRRIVLEERLVGEELSLFGVSDGETVVALATAQDHKRVGAGDTGPNTGGMGAFAPVPGIDPRRQQELSELFLEPAISGMAAEESPYVGVLFAGIMLTEAGPRLIEYNCRFGDPEAQVVLPLLASDGLELLAAAANGELAEIDIELYPGAAATVVVCADGYPADPVRGVPIPEIDPGESATVYYAGAAWSAEGKLVTTGGRVLAVTGTGPDLDTALQRSYAIVDDVVGQGLFARPDIGWRHSQVRAAT